MAVRAAPPKGKAGKGILAAKVGGIPVPLLVAGLAAAVFVGFYLRKRLASSTSSAGTPADTSASPSVDGSGGAGSSAAQPDLTPVEDLAQSIAGLIPFLGAGNFGSPQTTDTGTVAPLTTAPTAAATTTPTSFFQTPTAQILGPSGRVTTIAATPATERIAAYENPAGPAASAQQQQEAQTAAQSTLAGVNLFPAAVPPAPHAAATNVQPRPSQPVYGITYGLPAGKRASGGSVH